jgi:DNA-binding transcriptional ArsR family regulator
VQHGYVRVASPSAAASAPVPAANGDADIAAAAALFADATRARVLLALADGRALPASVLAAEAGVTPQAVSTQLGRLTTGGLIACEKSGRHRYYRLAGDQVAAIIEVLSTVAPAQPVRSLRQGTRAAALRRARTCYDHLAGRWGCDLAQALLDQQALQATDGEATTGRRPGDPLSAQLPDHPYELGPEAPNVLRALGVDLAAVQAAVRGRRPLLRFCLDWSEQRHHLAGALGAAVFRSFEQSGWLARRAGCRAVTITDLGRRELGCRIDLSVA